MITVDDSDPTPAFEQLRRGLEQLIRSGGLAPGHRLPSVRQLAGDLGLAPGTVARAVADLEAAGLVTTSRAGTRVAEVETLPSGLRGAARRFARAADGHSLDDAIAALRAEWPATRPRD